MAEPAVCRLTSVMQTCMCRAGAVCLLINTAPNTVIPPLLLTPVCKTVILVKILQGTSHAGQLLFLSLFRIVFHCSAKSSPNLKALATYRKTSISQIGAEQESCCYVSTPLFTSNLQPADLCGEQTSAVLMVEGKSIINATKNMSKYCVGEIAQLLLHVLSFH